MTEYFIFSNSFAAPFFSDSGTHYVKAESPKKALTKFVASYSHPCGLYAAILYRNADDYHKNKAPLAKWISNHEAAMQKATKRKSGYSYMGHAPGDFEIDGKRITVDDPKGGRIVAVKS